MSGFVPGPAPDPVVTVTMLTPFLHRFQAWARSQGFLVTTIPDEDPNAYIVVPRDQWCGDAITDPPHLGQR